jgi:5-methylcytosine-specific restriction endonuclease McrA
MNFKGKNNPNYKNGIYCKKHLCIVCKKPISLGSILYGSHKCKSCVRIGLKLNIKNRISTPICVDCKEELPLYSKAERCRSCTMKIRNFKNPPIGKNNGNWKGGVTKLYKQIRNSNKYKQLMDKVFKRDNYTCQKCNKIGNKLHVHHKLLFSFIIKLYNIKTIKQALECRLLWDMNWLITLCEKCHQFIHPEYNICKEKK